MDYLTLLLDHMQIEDAEDYTSGFYANNDSETESPLYKMYISMDPPCSNLEDFTKRLKVKSIKERSISKGTSRKRTFDNVNMSSSDQKKINSLIQRDKTPLKKRYKCNLLIREKLVQIIQGVEGYICWKEIRDTIQGNKSEIFIELSNLVKEGVIHLEGRGVRGDPYKYSMKETTK